MNPPLTFETERLVLLPTQLSDAAFILELLNSPKWKQNIGDRGVKTEEEAKNYIRDKMLPQLEKLGYGNYTLVRKGDKAKLGTCGLYDRDGLEVIDIGFALLPQYEGQGYACEAALRIMQAAKEDFEISAVSAITTESNSTSQKLIEKLGLTYRKKIYLPDDPEELLYYEVHF